MTAKEILTGAKALDKEIGSKLGSMRRLCGRGEMEVARLRLLCGGLAQDFRDLQARRKRMAEMIALLPDDNHRKLLTLRYMSGMRWRQIAGTMHYTTRHLQRLHQEALKALDHPGNTTTPQKKEHENGKYDQSA